ncbi:unnamed protein product [Euphydryas editha]|uniref:Reverse transcriptase domain-containing protein n=1 Tax=Euphydryas editha TaxID=104508 RepID=A0AAU9V157_EUPED|nr:unnamed protein product [Euphydryas editha]
MHKLDILLISETHFISSSLIKIKGYNIYHTNHPDGTAHGGTAVIIKATIKHYELPQYSTEPIQATSVAISDKNGDFNISAVYCPPKHRISEELFSKFFESLGCRFIVGGDWNAKHIHWGSRLITTRGRELKKSVDINHLTTTATSEPTHWPTDPNRLPDVLDFFISKGLSRLLFTVSSTLDGSSNHIPVILTISSKVKNNMKRLQLYNKWTDWDAFRNLISDELQLQIALKSEDDIDNATHKFMTTVQSACWKCTPDTSNSSPRHKLVPSEIKHQIMEKRRLRRVWHTSRHPEDKSALNKAIKDLKNTISKLNNASMESFLESLSATRATNYSLYRACKNINQPTNSKPPLRLENNIWARSQQQKADAFGEHLAKIFTPNEPDHDSNDTELENVLGQPFQLDLPIRPTTPKEIISIIKHMEDKRAPGFDLIDKKVLLELPKKGIVFLTILFNGILRIGYFPALWKVSQIIMIGKPGKPVHELTSYRPISLLPVTSKLFEKVMLRRLMRELQERSIIPDHQFGFRQHHGTVEQIHRVCRTIRDALERKEYCSAAFLDVQQAFDKVWHRGLLFKIKSLLPHTFFELVKSYLSDRIFQVKEEEHTSQFYPIKAGVPQGSVLGPVLYTVYTSDLPHIKDVTVATYADDTAILARSRCPQEASAILQRSLDQIDKWLTRWKIKASVTKSVHVTFTLRRGNCPTVSLRDNQLPQNDTVKYLGMHLDRRLTWKRHIQAKRDEIYHKYRGLYWMLARNSRLSVDNKLLLYKTAIKPIWTYGIQLWGSACDSSIEIIQRSQNYILKQVSNAPWFLRTSELHEHLNVNTVKQEIKNFNCSYKARLSGHPNDLAVQLTMPEAIRRLKRRHILDSVAS